MKAATRKKREEIRFEMRLVDFGSLKAMFTVHLGDLEIRGFKVLDQGGGKPPWIGVPSREIVKDGKREYYDIVRWSSEEARATFQELALEEYRKANHALEKRCPACGHVCALCICQREGV